jgi:phenylalanyl-tRNA synthetase alpha chain
MLNIVKKHLKEVKSFYSENDIEVEEFRIKYNGKKGVLNKLFKSFRDVH